MDTRAPKHNDDTPLDVVEVGQIKQIVQKIRSSLGQLPGDIGAEVTSLSATVEGHLAADPPNAVAAREALALIRDQLEPAATETAASLVTELDQMLKALGATE